MKKFFTVMALAAIFTACTGKADVATETNSTMQTDSINLNALNDKSVEMNMNGVSDTIVGNDGVQYVKMSATKPVAKTITRTPVATKRNTAAPRRSTTSSTGNTGTTTTASTPVAAKKKGWSNSAKGAVIGAGTGAAAGAIIGKNKVKSAIIGGAIGAGGGFIIGKVIDKKAESTQ